MPPLVRTIIDVGLALWAGYLVWTGALASAIATYTAASVGYAGVALGGMTITGIQSLFVVAAGWYLSLPTVIHIAITLGGLAALYVNYYADKHTDGDPLAAVVEMTTQAVTSLIRTVSRGATRIIDSAIKATARLIYDVGQGVGTIVDAAVGAVTGSTGSFFTFLLIGVGAYFIFSGSSNDSNDAHLTISGSQEDDTRPQELV